MNTHSFLLSVLFLLTDSAAATYADLASEPTPAAVVPNDHKYFLEKLHKAVDEADSVSPVAVPYSGKYPTIDISPWIDEASSTDDQRLQVVEQVLAQAVEAGSFNIIGHNVSVNILARVENATRDFFSQSIEVKNKYAGMNPFAGYTPTQKENYAANIYNSENEMERRGDLREIFGLIYPPSYPGNVQGPGYFQSALNEFIEQLQPVETALTKILSSALSLAKGVELPLTYVNDAESGATGGLRAHRYPAMSSEYDGAGKFLPHSDFSSATIVYGTEKGLEELRGGKWVEVPF